MNQQELKLCGFREDFNPQNRDLKKDIIDLEGKTYIISTIDLGLDHSFGGSEPIYYETMIFQLDRKGDIGEEHCQRRYTTREEALRNHEKIMERLKTKNCKLETIFC